MKWTNVWRYHRETFAHCIVFPSLIYGFWSDYPFGIFKRLPIVLSALLRSTVSDLITPVVSSNFCPLLCLPFFDLRFLIWLTLWYLQTFAHMQWAKAWRYQRGNQIRNRRSKKGRQYNGQKFEDTKGVIRSETVDQRRADNAMGKSLKIPQG
jgi:hypothetical protein